MKFSVILNRDGGTLRTLDLDALSARIRQTLGREGHEVDIEIPGRNGVAAALEKAAMKGRADVVMAGGGDGTISAAAGALAGKDAALAILPAGTMNLFARGLGIPQNLDAAVAAFATGRIRRVDVASANGRVFIHQYSVGMHPRLVELREEMDYGSRIGKMRASVRAAIMTLRRPPRVHATLELDSTELRIVASSLGISNNLFGEGHLPYAEMPDSGELGIYIARAWRGADIARFMMHMAAGRWQGNPEVEVRRATEATLILDKGGRGLTCAIDGELCEAEEKTVIRSLPGALKVLIPAAP